MRKGYEQGTKHNVPTHSRLLLKSSTRVPAQNENGPSSAESDRRPPDHYMIGPLVLRQGRETTTVLWNAFSVLSGGGVGHGGWSVEPLCLPCREYIVLLSPVKTSRYPRRVTIVFLLFALGPLVCIVDSRARRRRTTPAGIL